MNLQKNISLKKFSTFQVGGKADFFVEIFSKKDLMHALDMAEEKKIPVLFLGGGSNILFSDRGFKGVVLQFKNNTIHQDSEGNFDIESGARIAEIFSYTKKRNRDFAVFSTIPGMMGGAIAGNAGLPHGEIKDILLSVEVYDRKEKKFITHTKDFLEFSYRHSIFHEEKIRERYCIWSGKIFLEELEEKKIAEKAKEYLHTRKQKQPWGRTGGSFFKNPSEGAAGCFLEKAGFKGFCLGGAKFSEKHANFMMNTGNATASEILELGEKAQEKVFEKFGVRLEREVRVV